MKNGLPILIILLLLVAGTFATTPHSAIAAVGYTPTATVYCTGVQISGGEPGGKYTVTDISGEQPPQNVLADGSGSVFVPFDPPYSLGSWLHAGGSGNGFGTGFDYETESCTNPAPVVSSDGTPLFVCPNPDNRMNPACRTPWETAAVYCRADGTIQIYKVDANSKGSLVLNVTPAQLAKFPLHPDQNMLIAEAGGVRLYRLTTGEMQINASTATPGVDYVFTWNGCPTP